MFVHVVLLLNNTQYLRELSVLDDMVPENIQITSNCTFCKVAGAFVNIFKKVFSLMYTEFFMRGEGGQFVI